MSTDLIKQRLEEYYRTATPDQVLAELGAMGVEFVNIPEITEIEYRVDQQLPIAFNQDSQSWLEDFLIKPTDMDAGFPADVSSIVQHPTKQNSKENSQFATAA